MRIVVPYAGRIKPVVDRALHELAPDAERADVSESVFSYGRLLAQLWRDGDGFMLVEHDIELTARALDEARTCGCGWSCSPYIGVVRPACFPVKLTSSLGCTRFAAGLIRTYPALMARVNDLSDVPPADFTWHGDGPADAAPWWALDSRISRALGGHPCRHVEVPHHHAVADRCTCQMIVPEAMSERERAYRADAESRARRQAASASPDSYALARLLAVERLSG